MIEEGFLRKIAATLENERAFELNYKGVENIERASTTSASSVGPKRRSVIVSFAGTLCPCPSASR